MGSVKQLLTDAYDPVVGTERNLLEEDLTGLAMIKHSCSTAMITYRDVQILAEAKYDDIKDFKQLVEKAMQLKRDENN